MAFTLSHQLHLFFFFTALSILALHVSLSSSINPTTDTTPYFLTIPNCRGSIEECLIGDVEDTNEEFTMDTEINRRILATSRYISYGALSRNTIPCSRRGASYYNCRPGAQANPYSRGCSRITRCRR